MFFMFLSNFIASVLFWIILGHFGLITHSFWTKNNFFCIFFEKYLVNSKKSSTFAAAKEYRNSKNYIMEATLQQNVYSITVPKIDLKRFRGIVKAMGWRVAPCQKVEEEDITQTSGYKEAMEDVRMGRVTEYASVDDMFEKLGIAL